MQPDTGLKLFLADVVLQHGENAATLPIGDAIECAVDLVIIIDGFAYLARGSQRVVDHGAECALQRFPVEMAFRPVGMRRLVFHPGGKGFIEPDVVPPGGCHQIAEPHVRHLMGMSAGVIATLVQR